MKGSLIVHTIWTWPGHSPLSCSLASHCLALLYTMKSEGLEHFTTEKAQRDLSIKRNEKNMKQSLKDVLSFSSYSHIHFNSPTLDLLNVPISSFWAHRCDSPGPSQRAMSQTKGILFPLFSAKHLVIKPGTDQILPDLHTTETGREEGGVWRGWGPFFDVTTNDGAIGRCHAYALMSANAYTHMSQCRSESGL